MESFGTCFLVVYSSQFSAAEIVALVLVALPQGVYDGGGLLTDGLVQRNLDPSSATPWLSPPLPGCLTMVQRASSLVLHRGLQHNSRHLLIWYRGLLSVAFVHPAVTQCLPRLKFGFSIGLQLMLSLVGLSDCLLPSLTSPFLAWHISRGGPPSPSHSLQLECTWHSLFSDP